MNTMTLTTSTADLFDEFGRCIPATSQPVQEKSRRYFLCDKPQANHMEAYARMQRHLGPDLDISEQEFCDAIDRITQRLRDDPSTRNILNGVSLPFIIPRTMVTEIGTLLEEKFLQALAQAYESKFPTYRFTNHAVTGLAGKLSVLEGSRHERLINAMSKSDVVGMYFPSLTEYSIPASVEQLDKLPEHFLLSGGFDTCAALVGTPELLIRKDGYPPLLWLGGLAGEQPSIGYHLEAYGYNLTFNRRAHLNASAEYWWNGLTVLDQQ